MIKLNLMKSLCKIDTDKLRILLKKFLLNNGYKQIKCCDDFIMAEGNIPVCLVAHMDTVFPVPPYEENFFYDKKKKVLWNTAGAGFDDRAGIYAIIEIINKGFYPHIIFTNDEEIGAVGARNLVKIFEKCPFEFCKMIIQLDRANQNDMVFYNCNNPDFEEYIGKFGFEYDVGSFSDISAIAPAWEIAAVNLSIGYELEHTTSEILHTDWCEETINKVQSILKDAISAPTFKYIEKKSNDLLSNKYTCVYCGRTNKKNYKMYNKDYNWTYYCCPDCYIAYEIGQEKPFG